MYFPLLFRIIFFFFYSRANNIGSKNQSRSRN